MPEKYKTEKYKTEKHKKKGGCGCQSQVKSGGGALVPASFTNFDSNTTIPYNTSIGLKGSDPIDPSNVISTRMQSNMVGGTRRRKSKKNRKSMRKIRRTTRKSLKHRKYRGGNTGADITVTNQQNIVSSHNQTDGTFTGASIIHGVNLNVLNPSTFNPSPFI